MTIAILLTLDAVLSIALIVAARRNPFLRQRLSQAFGLLIGTHYATVHAKNPEIRYVDRIVEVPVRDADAPNYEDEEEASVHRFPLES